MNNHNRRISIALDGYSSTGKSTMAKTLARAIGYAYVDTGAMYRAVTLDALQQGIMRDGMVDEQALIDRLPRLRITFGPAPDGRNECYLNGINVERQIRSMQVSDNVSRVAAIGAVRRAMVKQQQAMGRDGGIVMDGRDIGTVVLPRAEMKVFVTADPQVRAQRRFDELRAKGDNTVTFDEVYRNIIERDRLDTTRAESPLRRAHDAVELDNSHLTVDEQNRWLLEHFEQTLNALDHDCHRD